MTFSILRTSKKYREIGEQRKHLFSWTFLFYFWCSFNFSSFFFVVEFHFRKHKKEKLSTLRQTLTGKRRSRKEIIHTKKVNFSWIISKSFSPIFQQYTYFYHHHSEKLKLSINVYFIFSKWYFYCTCTTTQSIQSDKYLKTENSL